MPKGDGLTRPLKLSDDLAAIVGVEEASRAECVKLLWAYLKANELQVNLCLKLFFLQIMGRTCCVQNLFLTFRTIFVHNMFSPCSAKRRASDKDLPVKSVAIGIFA